jgi:hypothetical protein
MRLVPIEHFRLRLQFRRPGDPLAEDPWLCVPALRPVCLFDCEGKVVCSFPQSFFRSNWRLSQKRPHVITDYAVQSSKNTLARSLQWVQHPRMPISVYSATTARQ